MNVKNIEVSKSSNASDVNLRSINDGKSVDQKKQPTPPNSDKLEISGEARKLQQIKNKIENGFYSQKEILQKTAQSILSKLK